MVVAITTKITGGNRNADISPIAYPFWDTINATFPLETMPTPTWTDSLAENPHSLAPKPHPTILVNTATNSNTNEIY